MGVCRVEKKIQRMHAQPWLKPATRSFVVVLSAAAALLQRPARIHSLRTASVFLCVRRSSVCKTGLALFSLRSGHYCAGPYYNSAAGHLPGPAARILPGSLSFIAAAIPAPPARSRTTPAKYNISLRGLTRQALSLLRLSTLTRKERRVNSSSAASSTHQRSYGRAAAASSSRFSPGRQTAHGMRTLRTSSSRTSRTSSSSSSSSFPSSPSTSPSSSPCRPSGRDSGALDFRAATPQERSSLTRGGGGGNAPFLGAHRPKQESKLARLI